MGKDSLGKQFERPVIIIAAARSGTKMLREVLAQSAMFVEFPYDMNYIWLYGNYGKKHDELSKSDLSAEISDFVKKRFQQLLKKSSAVRVLEKSVPNSLRVKFVREIFPEAQFIHLYRNGFDVTISAMQCWDSSLFSQRIQKKNDLIKKIISYPYLSAYPYLIDYVQNYLTRLFGGGKSLPSWGPRYKDIDKDVENLSLLEVCGIQWAHSVHASLQDLSSMKENEAFINVKYENLVNDPEKQLKRICDFLDISDAETVIKYGREKIHPESVDLYKDRLSVEEKEKLMPHIKSNLLTLGYLEG